MRNLITDVPGVLVGAADNARLASGVSVVLFETPAAAGIATMGGAPALRDGALLGAGDDGRAKSMRSCSRAARRSGSTPREA